MKASKANKSKFPPAVKRQPKKIAQPKVSAAELRQLLPNAMTEDLVEISDSMFRGDLDTIVETVKQKAYDAGIVGAIEIGHRTKRIKAKSHWTSSYTEKRLFLIGKRPYTDAELEAVGLSLISSERNRIQRAHKAEVKRVQKFNTLAKQMGQPVMALPVMPTLPEIPKT